MVNKYFCLITLITIIGVNLKCWAIDTMTGAYNERIKSLQAVANGNPFQPLMLTLGTDDTITFSFDHIADDREYLRYELIHCNANWQPSGLVDSEFLDGFNYGDIDQYDYSQNTTTHYTHYTLTLPNEDLYPKISGNYLLKIYPENDPDDVWAQYRFMVSEQSAIINAGVTTITDVDFNREHQQIGLSVDVEHSQIADPFNDLTVMIQQNGRYDNEVSLRQPLRMSGRTVSVYEHVPTLIFEAGNEYRRFETVSTIYPGMKVEDILYLDPYYHFVLETDYPRNDQMYLYDQTQFGRYQVREYNSVMSEIEADYAVVHFTLDIPEMTDAMIFLDGDFVNRRFDPESLMTYNQDTKRYERNMLLKQGAYNYQYLVVPKGKKRGYTSFIEGDKYQTVNEYLIKVYARHPGERYDRLIGVTLVYSN